MVRNRDRTVGASVLWGIDWELGVGHCQCQGQTKAKNDCELIANFHNKNEQGR